ncbi:hypothetical protein [Streptomyces hawaiiensis]
MPWRAAPVSRVRCCGSPAMPAGRSRAAGDPLTARRLWRVSEELTGPHFPPGRDAQAGV